MATIKQVSVPDIGDFKEVEVIEVMVSPGDAVNAEDSLVALESDKATMEVPSPYAGVVTQVHIRLGDKVSEGVQILTMEAQETAMETVAETEAPAQPAAHPEPPRQQGPQPVEPVPPEDPSADSEATALPTPPLPEATPLERAHFEEEPTHTPPQVAPPALIDESAFSKAHASPSVRRFARDLGVDLSRVKGKGRKGRILKTDIEVFIKHALAEAAAAPPSGALALPELPEIDFGAFGAIETRPLSRINKLSGANLQRNWMLIPHVTQYGDADITELEAFRKGLLYEAKRREVKLTLLAFLMKATVYALQEFPQFNASLGKGGENLVLKRYYHIGFAVDTPQGLVVPVMRDLDRKGLFDIAAELAELSARARDKKLTPGDMQGGCFTISSLGGLGGTAFAPIINWPEVAILGISRARMQPVYEDGGFVPRLMLPLSLSYDHRVIDGAAGARFVTFLGGLLSDIRRVLL